MITRLSSPLPFLAALALAAAAPAQNVTLFERTMKDHVIQYAESLSSPVLCDLDGDGDLDVVAVYGRLLGNHSGRFVPFPFSLAGVERPVLAADFDGDGRDDVLDKGNGTSLMRDLGVSLNRFPYSFQRTQLSFLPISTLDSQAVADFDGDGDLDLVLASVSSFRPLYQLVNDGSGNFTDATATRMPPPGTDYAGVWPVDADGDGDQDLIISDDRNRRWLALMVNQGGGVFAAPDASRFAGITATRVYETVDIDGDGDQDVVSDQDVLLNNAGRFTATPSPLIPVNGNTRHVRMHDFDSDGDLDAWIEFTPNGISTWFENPGNGGTFTSTTASVPLLRRNCSAVAVTHIDGDGRDDVLSVGDRVHALLGQPGGGLVDLAPEALVDRTYGDFDGDGYTDSLFTLGFFRLFLRKSDGAGGYTEQSAANGSFGVTSVWNQADLDGDGDVDLLVEGPWPNHTANVMLNDGTGFFTPLTGAVPASVVDVRWSYFADLDGDGDRDLLAHHNASNRFGDVTILRNDGSGRFAADPAWQIPALGNRNLVGTVFDADGDGDADFVVGDDDPILYRNDGTGVLTAAPGALPPRFATANVRPTILAPSDLDGDGDEDLFTIYTSLTQSGSTPAQNGCVYENDGTGTFSVARVFDGPEEWYDGALVDVDDDGDDDLVVTRTERIFGRSYRSIEIYDNDGSGVLTSGLRGFEGLTWTLNGQFVDVDDDGDVDFIGGYERPGVFANLTRQLRSRLVPRLGGTMELEVPNPMPTSRTAWFLISPARLAQPLAVPGIGRVVPDLSFGTALLVFNSFRLQPIQLSLPVPNQPALAGLEIYVQALADAWLPERRLTNTIRETLAF